MISISEKQLRALWSMIDQARGVASVLDVVELLTLILAAKAYEPEKLAAIGNMGAAHQKAEFERLIEIVAPHFPTNVISAPSFIDSELLRHLLRQCYEINELAVLIELVRFGLSRERHIFEASSFANEQALFKQLLGNTEQAVIYDGVAGVAATLASQPAKRLLLQDINSRTWQLGSRLLQLQQKEFDYRLGNSLLNPAFSKAAADIVVMTPPMGLKLQGSDLEQLKQADYVLHDELKATIPMTAADSLWIQHALYHMNANGKGYLLLAPGWLFRGGYDAALREYLVEHELIEAVIQLPADFLSFTKVAPVILVLNKARAKGSPVYLVDAQDLGKMVGKNLQFTEDDAQIVAKLSQGALPEDSRFRAVYLPEIRDNDTCLAINRYFEKTLQIAQADFAVELTKLQQLQTDYMQAQQQLMAIYNKIKH